MISSLDTGDERRRFFRITDTLGVAYRVLAEDDLEVSAGMMEEHASADPGTLIEAVDKTIQALLPQVRLKQPAVAQVLEALDKKLNYLFNQLAMDTRLVERIAHKVHEVNISACGMALVVDEPLVPDTMLALDLLLKPTNVHIHTRGQVVSCKLAGKEIAEAMQGTHYVRMEFRGMGLADQELLIQHIVQRQSLLIRADRDGS